MAVSLFLRAGLRREGEYSCQSYHYCITVLLYYVCTLAVIQLINTLNPLSRLLASHLISRLETYQIRNPFLAGTKRGLEDHLEPQ